MKTKFLINYIKNYIYLSLGGFNSSSAWSIVTPLKFNSSSGLPVPSQPGERRTGSVPIKALWFIHIYIFNLIVSRIVVLRTILRTLLMLQFEAIY